MRKRYHVVDDAQSLGFCLGFGGGFVLGFGAADAMEPVADPRKQSLEEALNYCENCHTETGRWLAVSSSSVKHERKQATASPRPVSLQPASQPPRVSGAESPGPRTLWAGLVQSILLLVFLHGYPTGVGIAILNDVVRIKVMVGAAPGGKRIHYFFGAAEEKAEQRLV